MAGTDAVRPLQQWPGNELTKEPASCVSSHGVDLGGKAPYAIAPHVSAETRGAFCPRPGPACYSLTPFLSASSALVWDYGPGYRDHRNEVIQGCEIIGSCGRSVFVVQSFVDVTHAVGQLVQDVRGCSAQRFTRW